MRRDFVVNGGKPSSFSATVVTEDKKKNNSTDFYLDCFVFV